MTHSEFVALVLRNNNVSEVSQLNTQRLVKLGRELWFDMATTRYGTGEWNATYCDYVDGKNALRNRNIDVVAMGLK